MKKVISETMGNEDVINMMCGLSWEGLEGVKEIMESLLNLSALEFSIHPLSIQALVMIRVILENNLGANHSRTARKQKVLLDAFCNKCLQQNNVWVVARHLGRVEEKEGL